MCGRFVSKDDPRKLAEFYSVTKIKPSFYAPSHNVAPTESAPIVIEGEDQERELLLARFGLPVIAGPRKFLLTNLQSEKAANRKDLSNRRCIIPAAGFYEWEVFGPKDKQPHYYSPKEGILSFAGVWNKSLEGLHFSIFTTVANELLQPVHNRMPVILGHNETGDWLARGTPKETLMDLMRPYPASLMQEWKVSKAVNSPKNKDAACINSL